MQSSAHGAVKLAADRMRGGNQPAAKRILLSHGAAVRGPQAVSRIKGFHPDYGQELEPHPQLASKITVETAQCHAKMVQGALRRNAPTDPYGWSHDLFYGDVDRKRANGRPTLLDQVARLSALTASASLPPDAYLLFTVAFVSELNKVDRDAQEERLNQGLEPKTRPIAATCEVGKVALSAAKDTAPAKRAQSDLAPIQIGCGVKEGSAIMAATAQTLHLSGYAVKLDDKVSAFSSISRQAIHDGVNTMLPEANALVQAFYGAPSPVFYLYFDRDRRVWVIEIFWNREGPRQGCTWGTFLYCMGVQRSNATLAREFPNVYARAQCDDNLRAVRPLPGQSWADTYLLLARYIDREDELYDALHLRRHHDKSFLVLAPGSPPPFFECLSVKQTHGHS